MSTKVHSRTKITPTAAGAQLPRGKAMRSGLADLWNAYHQTRYANHRWCLTPGRPRPESIPNTHVLIWLTAANPGSQRMNDASNRAANKRLRAAIEKWNSQHPDTPHEEAMNTLPVLQAADAQPRTNDWPVEKGWFVLVPAAIWAHSSSWWEHLADRFGQNAIVVAEPGKPVTIQAVSDSFRSQLASANLLDKHSPTRSQESH